MKNRNFFIALIIAAGLFYIWQIYIPRNFGAKQQQLFLIERGRGVKDIASALEDQKLIKNRIIFQLYAIVSGNFQKLQAGSYFLSPGMNVPQMINKFVSGEVAAIKLTIPEGYTIQEIQNGLNRAILQSGFAKEELNITQLKAEKFNSKYGFLKNLPRNAGLEGFLFPDTYLILYGDNAEIAAGRMLDNFNLKLAPELRSEIIQQDKAIFEIITMASLIEKEDRSLENRKIISGILWKRLEAGIALQVDATIVYITGKKTAKVSAQDTKANSPYNTYKYRGLPPGPIANPGLESILAAVYPEKSDYLYYLSTPEGKTIFSKTLEEHNLTKTKYLK